MKKSGKKVVQSTDGCTGVCDCQCCSAKPDLPFVPPDKGEILPDKEFLEEHGDGFKKSRPKKPKGGSG